ncbi:hypothetical protein CFAM422_008569 [Trichoderma lentiforme]|uniref:Uncharacterized protein n=1 Tax=Trichoderma lentiforme TaxID=1567552 RepID=A0A9P5CCR1_9HYPO|nr:hypothetical protein CFAM422_008569 [Trichoderma lentiforme]
MSELLSWRGLRAKKKADGGFVVLSTINTVVCETLKCRQLCHFIKHKLLGRCRYLVYNFGKDKESKHYKAILKSLNAGEEVHFAYVGFDANMRGPVFAYKKKTKKGADDPTDDEGGESDLLLFNMKGVVFKFEPLHQVVGQGLLPHYSVTSPANCIAMKRYVDGESLQTLIPDADLRREYLNGVKDLWVRLHQGKNVAPPELVPISRGDDTAEAEDGAPRVGQRSCNASLMWRSLNAPSGYQLKLVYVNALDIPQELLTILEEFANKFPNDHLTIPLMITACFLYKDIINSKDMKLEMYRQAAKGAKPEVPLVYLAACIIYLSHMLRWTEWMELADYPHPFTFIHRALQSDMVNGAMGVGPESIDEERVLKLLENVKSNVPGISVQSRLLILPFQMPGSKMPQMHGPGAPARIQQIQYSLAGLTNIRYYGLDDYSRPPRPPNPQTRSEFYKLESKYSEVVIPAWATLNSWLEQGTIFDERVASIWDDSSLWPYWEPKSSHASTLYGPAPRPEPDYAKYSAAMEFWSQMRGNIHLSWIEGRDEARRLEVGSRSASVLRKLVTKAMREEVHDVEYVRFKLNSATDRHPLLQDDVERAIPLALGRLMGIGPPDDEDQTALMSDNLWRGNFIPRSTLKLNLGNAMQYADEIMQTFESAQMGDSSELEAMGRKGTELLAKLSDCLRDATHMEFLSKWKALFPEISKYGSGPDEQPPQLDPGVQQSHDDSHEQSLSTRGGSGSGEEAPQLNPGVQPSQGKSHEQSPSTGGGSGPNEQPPQVVNPGTESSEAISHNQSPSAGEERPPLDNGAEAASEQPVVAHVGTTLPVVKELVTAQDYDEMKRLSEESSTFDNQAARQGIEWPLLAQSQQLLTLADEAEDVSDELLDQFLNYDGCMEPMGEAAATAAQHDDPEPFPHTEGQLNEEAPASNEQMPDAEGQTSKAIEQPSNLNSLMYAVAAAAIANGPLLDHPLRNYVDWRTPAKSTPPVRGNDDAPGSNDETPSSEGVGGEVRCSITKIQLLEKQILTPDKQATGNAWPPERIIAFINDLSEDARISDWTIVRTVELEDGWYIHRNWPSAQEVASLVREIADKHPRPIPTDLANGLADWEEHGMNV